MAAIAGREVHLCNNKKNPRNNMNCCVPQCKNRARINSDLSYHQFPRINASWAKHKQGTVMKRRQEWIHVLRIGKDVSNRMLVCSEHFKETDFIFPGVYSQRRNLKKTAVPSLKLPLRSCESKENRSHQLKKVQESEKRYDVLTRKKEQFNETEIIQDEIQLDQVNDNEDSIISAAEALLYLSRITEQEVMLNRPTLEDKSVQVCSGDLQSKVLINISLLTDKQMNSLTGVPEKKMFNTITSLASELIKLHPKDVLSLQQRILLCLMKLKLNLNFVVLAVLFGCTSTTCSSYFSKTVHALATVLRPLIHWPDREEIIANMPKCFKKFGNVRIVLDCTEIPVEQPKCLRCRVMSYSNYKKTNTIKYMLCVSPGGIITYISKGYGGRTSDKAIFDQSNVIKMLEPYIDEVMVDKGFKISDVCDEFGIYTVRPPFLKEKKQLSAKDALLTKYIASARVHVERVIQRVKIFKLLHVGKFPWRSLGLADELVIIAVALSNMGAPILADDKFLD